MMMMIQTSAQNNIVPNANEHSCFFRAAAPVLEICSWALFLFLSALVIARPPNRALHYRLRIVPATWLIQVLIIL